MRIARRIAWTVAVLAVVLAAAREAPACECVGTEPFFAVVPRSPLVVRAKVLGYHGSGSENRPLAMDLEVLEVLCGEAEASRLRVWGGDGLLCRPEVTEFPTGTEWVFALDGPGSKPGMTPAHALSICGQYWLRVTDGKVSGKIDDTGSPRAAQGLALSELRRRLPAAFALPVPPRRVRGMFGGEVQSTQSFEHAFGQRFLFRLDPSLLGWMLTVRERGRDEDLSRLTPPFHIVPNPRMIEGWHFRNSDNTGPNRAGEKNVNAPGEVREFIFSPDVGRTIQGAQTASAVTGEEVEAVRRFGQGQLSILEMRLNRLAPGQQAGIEWMRFEVILTWLEGPAAEERTACRPCPGRLRDR